MLEMIIIIIIIISSGVMQGYGQRPENMCP
jgi:hypothetical protein